MREAARRRACAAAGDCPRLRHQNLPLVGLPKPGDAGRTPSSVPPSRSRSPARPHPRPRSRRTTSVTAAATSPSSATCRSRTPPCAGVRQTGDSPGERDRGDRGPRAGPVLAARPLQALPVAGGEPGPRAGRPAASPPRAVGQADPADDPVDVVGSRGPQGLRARAVTPPARPRAAALAGSTLPPMSRGQRHLVGAELRQSRPRPAGSPHPRRSRPGTWRAGRRPSGGRACRGCARVLPGRRSPAGGDGAALS